MKNVTTVGIDLAKNIFQLYGVDVQGQEVFNKRVTRAKLMEFLIQLPSRCLVVMESCSSANYWGRKLINLGYAVKLISPQFVKPYVLGNKNDRNDSKAIVEASSRSDMRYVSVKSLEQQDLQSLHRARSLGIRNRTGEANQIRGLLAEYGVTIPQGIRYIRSHLMGILSDKENGLTESIRGIVQDIYEQFKSVDRFIKTYDEKILSLAQQNEDCQRLVQLPGVGPLIATAFVSKLGKGKEFKKGREVSAYLGLTPKHSASGHQYKAQGLSKRGDVYLRTLIIHGARSVLQRCRNKTDKRSVWALDKLERLGYNKASVALANKTAREMWAVLKKGDAFSFASSLAS